MPINPSQEFMAEHRSMEAIYVASDDPMKQSGFHGGRDRWIAERRPLVEAFEHDGDFLDVGCANGLLAEDVVGWAAEIGLRVVPHGIDLGTSLVQFARDRLPAYADNFVSADVWHWEPARKWTYIYCLTDVAPDDLRCELIIRLFRLVEQSGRLILGSYRSSDGQEPQNPRSWLRDCGFTIGGTSRGGTGAASLFAWTTAKDAAA